MFEATTELRAEAIKCGRTSVARRSFVPFQSALTLTTSGSFGSRFSCFTLIGGFRRVGQRRQFDDYDRNPAGTDGPRAAS